jgi:hypothetical protein
MLQARPIYVTSIGRDVTTRCFCVLVFRSQRPSHFSWTIVTLDTISPNVGLQVEHLTMSVEDMLVVFSRNYCVASIVPLHPAQRRRSVGGAERRLSTFYSFTKANIRVSVYPYILIYN